MQQLYVLNQLGHESSLMTTLGGDQSSKQLLNGLQERHIQTEHIQRFIQGQTPTSYVLLNEASGSRTITHYRDLPELNFDFLPKSKSNNMIGCTLKVETSTT